jgi:coenzyme F420-reducing hydrogenase gamma subunit
VYATPSYIETLRTSTAIASRVRVDFELRGCPIDRRQLVRAFRAFTAGAEPFRKEAEAHDPQQGAGGMKLGILCQELRSSSYSAAICAAYCSVTTLRRTFNVGVSCPPASVNSPETMANFLIASARDTAWLA